LLYDRVLTCVGKKTCGSNSQAGRSYIEALASVNFL